MKIKSPFKLALSLLAVASTALIASASQAATFDVVVDTSALVGGNYLLDFQLNDGGVLGNNRVRVNDFANLVVGKVVDSPTTFGGAVGDIGSVVIFDNSSFSQELYQSFVAGSVFGFTVDLTTNSDGETPDSFVFAILDSNLQNIQTTGLGNSLFQVNIGATPTVQIGTGVNPFVSVTATAVPEPTSTVALLGLGCAGMFIGKRKKALSK
jgi:hypothetical protein